jgi:RNA polymerase sigma factor (sigma-70 family)
MSGLAKVLADDLAALQHGDRDALNRLIAACQGQIEHLTRRQLRNHPEFRDGFNDTDDIVQEASVSLFKALQHLQPESEQHLFNLAAMQVRRRIIDLARKFRGPQSPVALRATNVVRHADGDIVRSEQAAAAATAPSLLDDWERFHQAVDSLPEKMKTTFSMRFYLAAKPTNIAQTLGCDVRTVRRYWSAAKEEIRRKLKDTA